MGMCAKIQGLRDALRVFISEPNHNLTDVLFAAHPPDLSSALALAQEVEANHERYAFAARFARGQEKGAAPTREATSAICPRLSG